MTIKFGFILCLALLPFFGVAQTSDQTINGIRLLTVPVSISPTLNGIEVFVSTNDENVTAYDIYVTYRQDNNTLTKTAVLQQAVFYNSNGAATPPYWSVETFWMGTSFRVLSIQVLPKHDPVAFYF